MESLRAKNGLVTELWKTLNYNIPYNGMDEKKTATQRGPVQLYSIEFDFVVIKLILSKKNSTPFFINVAL